MPHRRTRTPSDFNNRQHEKSSFLSVKKPSLQPFCSPRANNAPHHLFPNSVPKEALHIDRHDVDDESEGNDDAMLFTPTQQHWGGLRGVSSQLTVPTKVVNTRSSTMHIGVARNKPPNACKTKTSTRSNPYKSKLESFLTGTTKKQQPTEDWSVSEISNPMAPLPTSDRRRLPLATTRAATMHPYGSGCCSDSDSSSSDGSDSDDPRQTLFDIHDLAEDDDDDDFDLDGYFGACKLTSRGDDDSCGTIDSTETESEEFKG